MHKAARWLSAQLFRQKQTASISLGKISVFSFWPSQQSCLRCRFTHSLFSLTKLAKALWARGSLVKEKICGNVSGEKMLMTRLALCVNCLCDIEHQLMLFSCFCGFKPSSKLRLETEANVDELQFLYRPLEAGELNNKHICSQQTFQVIETK